MRGKPERKTALLRTALFFLFALANTSPVIALQSQAKVGDSAKKKKVFVFELNQDIFPAAWRLVKNAMNEADQMHADYVVIKENTYGGDLASADSIHSRLLHARQPVLIWITQNAASAGALIAISCDSIYMRSSAVIGSASVVNENGEVMPDKYQSYMRAMMRSTAEKNGRDPLIAEGMVTPNGYLHDVADTGRIIALTATEAVKHGYCNGIAETLDDVLKQAHIGPYSIINYQSSLLDAIIALLLNPFVSGVLLVAGEVFLLPGHGVMLISGFACIVGGLTLSLVRNSDLDFSFTSSKDVIVALLRVVIPLALSFFLFISFGQSIFKSGALKGFVLTQTQGHFSESRSITGLRSVIDKSGVAITSLRPAGQIEVEGERYDAMAENGFISMGQPVRVVQVSGNILVVRNA